MTWEAWIMFATFWAVFVTTPGPNAVNCITNGMSIGFRRSLPGVAAILCQAALFLALSAVGVTALILASPMAFQVLKFAGAAFLIWLGIRGWMVARRPLRLAQGSGSVFGRAFVIATVNPKSVAGYLAAFSQFVAPGVPMAEQIWIIVPTALSLTCLSYLGYTALGAGLGRAALGAIATLWVRRVLAGCFVIYGALLGASSVSARG